MPKKPNPVTESEAEEVVLKALAKAFKGRVVTEGVIRRGLRHVQFDAIMLHLKEVAAGRVP